MQRHNHQYHNNHSPLPNPTAASDLEATPKLQSNIMPLKSHHYPIHLLSLLPPNPPIPMTTVAILNPSLIPMPNSLISVPNFSVVCLSNWDITKRSSTLPFDLLAECMNSEGGVERLKGLEVSVSVFGVLVSVVSN
jgi:hypothetical protein